MIRDPDVSFDGKRILFVWKKSDLTDDYHLYEVGLQRGRETLAPRVGQDRLLDRFGGALLWGLRRSKCVVAPGEREVRAFSRQTKTRGAD